jgi:ABC-type bacteriocin/lantibiotic exporter with double-glycine peptidase domain
MLDKPPLRKQETLYSCAPACLRMVLESLGVFKTEQELRELCDCTYDSVFLPGGTDPHPFKLKAAAQSLDFANTRIANLSFDELKSELERGLYPIVYIKTRLVSNKPLQLHAVVIAEIGEVVVEVIDPWRGEHVFSIEDFLTEWGLARRITILVEQ